MPPYARHCYIYIHTHICLYFVYLLFLQKTTYIVWSWERLVLLEEDQEAQTEGRYIDIKKIENDDNLMVTFSKRRNGLLKKASELCLLRRLPSSYSLLVVGPKGSVNKSCLHYTQMVWRESLKIGCARVTRRSGDTLNYLQL